MRERLATGLIIGAIVSSAVVVAAQQGQRSPAWSVPRMPDGHPDLQGVWANNNMTPLERPAQFAGRATMSDVELASVKQRAKELMDGDHTGAERRRAPHRDDPRRARVPD